MPRFSYKAFTADGRTLEGEADAASPKALGVALASRGLMLVSHSGKSTSGKAGRGNVSSASVTALFNELALMLRSGLPIDEALDLSVQGAPQHLARAIRAVRDDMRDGASVSQALERQSAVLGREIGPLARVAETTGDFEGMLRAVAAQRARVERLREKLIGAVRYPAFLLLSALSVFVFFLLHVIPQFSGLFKESGNDPGPLVRGVIAVSDVMVANSFELEVGTLLFLAAALGLSRIAQVRQTCTGLFLRCPGVHGAWVLWRASVLLSTLGTLLGQGVPLHRALQLVEDIVGAQDRESLRQVGDGVRRGDRLHAALSRGQLLPPLALRMLGIGESTGELATVATEAGALYAQKLEIRLDAITGIIGPAAIILIATLVGGLMVTIMSALTSVNQSIF